MTRTVVRADPLLEREAELGAIAAVLDAAATGHGAALLVEGPAGIGKTRLLEAARTAAADRGFRVLVARAGPLEREFAFGVVRGLLEPVLQAASPDERAELLDGAARLAVPVLDPGATPPTGFATLHGIYWLLAGLAERTPLLLAVDDAHWADEPSLRALSHLAHRIEELPVLLVVTTRPAEQAESGELLDALRAEPATRVLHPGALSPAASAVLLTQVFGTHPHDGFVAACAEAGGGNPLLLGALARSLAEAGLPPSESSVPAVHDRAPGIVGAFVLPRLRHLPRPAAAVARALAVLGPGAQLRHLAAVAGLDPAETALAVDRLVAAELVTTEPRPGFVHPLVAQAIADHMPAGERHLAHRTAARELAADDAPAEAVAAHLLGVEPLRDDEVVAWLRAAAREAMGKGAPGPAVAYLERAVAEPPAAGLRPQVLFELGDAETYLGPMSGLDRLAEALAATREPTARARVTLRLARGLESAWELPRALEVLRPAVLEADRGHAVDPQVRRQLEAEYVSLARTRPALRADALQRLARLRPGARPDTAAGCTLIAASAAELLQEPGRAGEAVAEARAALTGVLGPDGSSFATGLLYQVNPVLMAAGELAEGYAAADASAADARGRGALIELGAALGSRAEVARRRGDLLDAEADLRFSVELARGAGVVYPQRLLLGTLLPLLVERGELDAAGRLVDELDRPAHHVALLTAVGVVRRAQGRAAEALELLDDVGVRLAERGWRHPGWLPWRTESALALHALGRVPEARERAAEAVAVARRYAAPIETGTAVRTLGLVTDDVALLREAVDLLGATAARLEHARALVELGAALRRANRRVDAREPLREGLDLASRRGGTALVRQAMTELAAAGARPRSPRRTGLEALSPSERRVAQLAADGMTNRDIAQALFVTTKTVEAHLSAAYRKLGVASRAELPAVLG